MPTPSDTIEFTGCRPVFHVKDLRLSLPFYVDRLGFTEDWGRTDNIMNAPDEDRFTFCYVFCSGFELFLREVDSPNPGEIVVGCPSRQHVDHTYQSYVARGVEVDEPPKDRPWGAYEMVVRDPDGNALRILH